MKEYDNRENSPERTESSAEKADRSSQSHFANHQRASSIGTGHERFEMDNLVVETSKIMIIDF